MPHDVNAVCACTCPLLRAPRVYSVYSCMRFRLHAHSQYTTLVHISAHVRRHAAYVRADVYLQERPAVDHASAA